MVKVVMRDNTWHEVEELRAQVIRQAMREHESYIDIFGDERVVVSVSAISQLMREDEFEHWQHQRNGDFKCPFGYWHARHEVCGHTSAEVTDPYKYGEPLPGKSYNSVQARWVRKRVTDRQFSKFYAARPGYHVLETDGTDRIIAYTKVLTEGFKLKTDEAWCTVDEIARLSGWTDGPTDIPDDFYSEERTAERQAINREKYKPQWKKDLEAEQQRREKKSARAKAKQN